VTEGVRGEGGVLKNAKGERFMFRYMPDMFKGDFAESEAESDAWVAGERKKNRRPPELLTRDVVAKAITKEIAEGRGSPHGGVFLDIASKQNPDYIKKKLPSMYHQFRELAQVDITKDPMEIGPTTHYVMGGVKVEAETQESTVPGLYAAGEVGGGMHGANRLGGNSLSDLLVFGRRAGQHAASKRGPAPAIPDAEIDAAVREALEPFERAGENPFAVQSALQAVMQRNAGIIRDKGGLETALTELERLKGRAKKVGITGSREYNPGWHTAIDLHSLLVVSEATARAALERTESRGGHTRSDFPDSDERQTREQIVIKKEGNRMAVRREAQPSLPAELEKIIKEAK
jgi:succinate dehydrogenase / fumarate reductase flavoprotein subunit